MRSRTREGPPMLQSNPKRERQMHLRYATSFTRIASRLAIASAMGLGSAVAMAEEAAVVAEVDRTELPINRPGYPPIVEVKAQKDAPNIDRIANEGALFTDYSK
jgi:hypothetical protein